MPRPRKSFPISFCLSLRERGYSYEMIAWKLQQLGYDVSKWTVMRRLSPIERSSSCGHNNQETVATGGPGQSGCDFAPSTSNIQHENPGFSAQRLEEASIDLLAGEVESFDELVDRLKGCHEA